MNETNRQKVLDYLSTVSTSPLYFHNYKSTKEEFDPSKFTVEDMIKKVLTLSEEFLSMSKENGYECSAQRWRSSVDIWRHIIYYYPDVTIFEVMKGIYDIREECGGQYCYDVNRRVFKYKSGSERNKRNSTYWDNNQPGSFSFHVSDEYNLYFADWKDI
jgi:hypothetical protein